MNASSKAVARSRDWIVKDDRVFSEAFTEPTASTADSKIHRKETRIEYEFRLNP